jgi:hypothetical protein
MAGVEGAARLEAAWEGVWKEATD